MSGQDVSGVGISFRMHGLSAKKGFSVVRVSPGGPSDGSGIEAGDTLESVDGEQVEWMSFEELASRLSGPHSSQVALAFSRARANSASPYEFEVAITRGSKPRPPQPNHYPQPIYLSQPHSAPPPPQNQQQQQQRMHASQPHAPPPRASPQPSSVKLPHQAPGRDYQTVYIQRVMPPDGTVAPEGQVGIGVQFTTTDSQTYFSVVNLREGGGAARSGTIKRGDYICSIDGVDCRGRKVEEVVAMIRGPVGSTVSVGILRNTAPTSPGPAPAALQPSSMGAGGNLYSSGGANMYATGESQQSLLRVQTQPAEVPQAGPTKIVPLTRQATPGKPQAGVGIQWTKDERSGILVVKALVEGGPAHRSSTVVPGDSLLAVDGAPVTGMAYEHVVGMIRGVEGTVVHLALRPGEVRPRAAPPAAAYMMVVDEKDAPTMAEEARLARLVRLTNQSWGDTLVLWVVHALVFATFWLLLTFNGSIPLDWNLNQNFLGDGVLAAWSMQGYFYALAPIGALFGLFVLYLLALLFSTLQLGRLATHYIFGNRAGLVSLAIYGNIFVAGSALLLYFYLARPECCDVVYTATEEAWSLFLPIIMAPMTGGIVLFFIWALIEIVCTDTAGHTRNLRRSIFPVADIGVLVACGALFIAAEVLFWLRVDGTVTFNWLLVSTPLHALVVLILVWSIVSGVTADLRLNPVAARRLAATGVIDSLTFGVIEVFVFIKLEYPLWVSAWGWYLVVPLAFMGGCYTVWLIWDIVSLFACPHDPPQPHDFFEAKAQAFIAPGHTNDVSARITWPVPGPTDGRPEPPAEYKVELQENGTWTVKYFGSESVVTIAGLSSGAPAVLRVSAFGGGAGRGVMNVLSKLDVPERVDVVHSGAALPGTAQQSPPSPSFAPVMITVEPPSPYASASQVQLQPTQVASEPRPSYYQSPPIPPMPPIVQERQFPAAPQMPAPPPPQHAPPTGVGGVTGPLFLKDLQPAGDGGLFGVFEWLHQKHFAANILDLELVTAGDGSETHDYTMVYAGAENVVRIYNILPGSYYRMRLRAGDFEDNDLKTVVERCILPFATPSLAHLATDGSAASNAVALGAAGPPNYNLFGSGQSLRAVPLQQLREPSPTLAHPHIFLPPSGGQSAAEARLHVARTIAANVPVVLPTTSQPSAPSYQGSMAPNGNTQGMIVPYGYSSGYSSQGRRV